MLITLAPMSLEAMKAIGAHPELVEFTEEQIREQVRDELLKAGAERVGDRLDRHRALDAAQRLTPATPEDLQNLARQQALEQLIAQQMDAQTRGISR